MLYGLFVKFLLFREWHLQQQLLLPGQQDFFFLSWQSALLALEHADTAFSCTGLPMNEAHKGGVVHDYCWLLAPPPLSPST